MKHRHITPEASEIAFSVLRATENAIATLPHSTLKIAERALLDLSRNEQIADATGGRSAEYLHHVGRVWAELRARELAS